MMISWGNRGVAPIYLCESHAAELSQSGKNCEGLQATAPQSVRRDDLTEQPKSAIPSSTPADGQVELGEELGEDDLADLEAAVAKVASGDSAKTLRREAIEDVGREDFEAHGTVLQRAKSTAMEDKQAETADLERLCMSRYGERCTGEATVHCPKCGRWFCDAHAEYEKWHPCAPRI